MTLYTELPSDGASDARRLVHVEPDQASALINDHER